MIFQISILVHECFVIHDFGRLASAINDNWSPDLSGNESKQLVDYCSRSNKDEQVVSISLPIGSVQPALWWVLVNHRDELATATE